VIDRRSRAQLSGYSEYYNTLERYSELVQTALNAILVHCQMKRCSDIPS
jgi:hypothetical protein